MPAPAASPCAPSGPKSQRIGCFFHAQAAKETQFHRADFSRIHLCQGFQRIVQSHQLAVSARRGEIYFLKGNSLRPPPRFELPRARAASTRMRRSNCAARPKNSLRLRKLNPCDLASRTYNSFTRDDGSGAPPVRTQFAASPSAADRHKPSGPDAPEPAGRPRSTPAAIP